MASTELEIGMFEKATAIVNPVSSNSAKGRRRLDRIAMKAPFEIEIVETSKFTDKNNGLIRYALENSDVVMVVAGDGTFNQVVNTILSNDVSDKAQNVPLWSIGGGNADDGSKASHTKLYFRHPERILDKDKIRVIDAYPIMSKVINPFTNETEQYAAAFYASFGMSASAASEQYINNPKYRRLFGKFALGRVLSEPVLIARAAWDTSDNTVYREGDETQTFYEQIFANSSIMAKAFHFPTALAKQEIFHATIDHKHNLLSAVVQARRGRLDGEYMYEEDVYSFTTAHDLMAQFDGEAIKIPPNRSVSIWQHDQPIKLVVTRPDL